MSVDLVLPRLNEAAALPWVLARLPAGVRAVVVDNGSTDGSAETGAIVGCHAGLKAAEAIAFIEADASLDPRQLVRVTAPVPAGGVDLMIGRRRPVSQAVFDTSKVLAW